MTGRSVYHLGLDSGAIEGATLALVPGDPGRVPHLAGLPPFERGRELALKREYHTWLAYMHGTPVLVTSTGIGGASASIAIDELAQLGVRTFIRVGTTGAIQPHVNVGDVVITTGAVRLDGASAHYAPIEYPAVADHTVVEALVRAAHDTGTSAHVGVTCSTDTFYPGQERYDSYAGYVPRRFQGITDEWRRLRVLNYEMEAATLLTLTSAMGLRGGTVAGVVVNRTRSEAITNADLDLGEGNSIKVAVRAVELLLKEGA
jgi:uridine phosphorylase